MVIQYTSYRDSLSQLLPAAVNHLSVYSVTFHVSLDISYKTFTCPYTLCFVGVLAIVFLNTIMLLLFF